MPRSLSKSVMFTNKKNQKITFKGKNQYQIKKINQKIKIIIYKKKNVYLKKKYSEEQNFK